MRTIPRATLLLGLLLAAVPAWAAPTLFSIVPGEDGNQVSFLSKAPMETVEGKTDQATGSVSVDLEDLRAGCRVEVRVDLASIDTGIGKRNQHMRENHLETDKYPHAVFTADSVVATSGAALAPGATATLTLAGDFALHGVTRRIEVPVTVTRSADGRALDVASTFDVKLADYEISRPKFLIMKLDEVQHVTVALTAHSRGQEG